MKEKEKPKKKQMENLKSNSCLTDSKCEECFRKEMKYCLQQMEMCKFFSTLELESLNGSVSETEE